MAGKKRKRSQAFEITKRVLIIIYVVIAVLFNCWVISTFMLSANRPTVVQGRVDSTEDQAPVPGAVVGARTNDVLGSPTIRATTDAAGRYRIVIPRDYRNFQLFCTFGGANGTIVEAPKKFLWGRPLRPGESEFRVVLHRVNNVDWEVSTR